MADSSNPKTTSGRIPNQVVTSVEREKAWDSGKIVWQASYRGRKAIIKSNFSTRMYPNWLLENAEHVRWKVLAGGEWL